MASSLYVTSFYLPFPSPLYFSHQLINKYTLLTLIAGHIAWHTSAGFVRMVLESPAGTCKDADSRCRGADVPQLGQVDRRVYGFTTLLRRQA